MNRKQRIIVSVTGIFVVFLALLGITYGYFLTRIQGNTNDTSISITTADLSIICDDNNSQINVANIQPSDAVYSKTFTVTNDGDTEIEYAVYLIDILNQFKHYDDLQFYITCESNIGECNGYYGVDNNNDGIISFDVGSVDVVAKFPTEPTRLVTNKISPKVGNTAAEVHTYTLYFNFRDNGDQSDDMGKELKGKIQIEVPNNVVTINGTVNVPEGDTTNYSVKWHSNPMVSQLNSDNKFIFEGVTPEEHTLYVTYIDENGIEQIAGSKTVDVRLGTDVSITLNNDSKSTIVINDSVVSANIDVTVDNSSISLSDGNLKTLGGFANNTLAGKIITDNELKYGGNLDFYKIANGLYYTNKNTENNEISYFYRGNVNNNYIKFGSYELEGGYCTTTVDGTIYDVVDKNGNTVTSRSQCESALYNYNGMASIIMVGFENVDECSNSTNGMELGGCSDLEMVGTWNSAGNVDLYWRIVRINEDGSVRLLYHGNDISTLSSIGQSAYTIDTFADYTNGANNIKSLLNTWYEKNLSNFSSSIVDAGFCNDTSNTGNKALGSGSMYHFGFEQRNANNVPQYACPNNSDLFTTSSSSKGNKSLLYPIGLLTADEVKFAGSNYNHLFSQPTIYLSNYDGWTMSPINYQLGDVEGNGGFVVSVNSALINGQVQAPNVNKDIYPVINIDGTLLVRGKGTIGDPYYIAE